jgi:hypothetical protein
LLNDKGALQFHPDDVKRAFHEQRVEAGAPVRYLAPMAKLPTTTTTTTGFARGLTVAR